MLATRMPYLSLFFYALKLVLKLNHTLGVPPAVRGAPHILRANLLILEFRGSGAIFSKGIITFQDI